MSVAFPSDPHDPLRSYYLAHSALGPVRPTQTGALYCGVTAATASSAPRLEPTSFAGQRLLELLRVAVDRLLATPARDAELPLALLARAGRYRIRS